MNKFWNIQMFVHLFCFETFINCIYAWFVCKFYKKGTLLLWVNSGRYLFDVLTIKLSLHKLITELNTHCVGVNKHSNIQNWKLIFVHALYCIWVKIQKKKLCGFYNFIIITSFTVGIKSGENDLVFRNVKLMQLWSFHK